MTGQVSHAVAHGGVHIHGIGTVIAVLVVLVVLLAGVAYAAWRAHSRSRPPLDDWHHDREGRRSWP